MSEKLLCYRVSGLILCEENMRHSERLRRCYNHRSGVSDRVHSHFAWLMEISCLICINFPLFHYSGRCTHWSAPRNPGLSLADKMWSEEADDWWRDWAQWTGLLANIHPSLAQQAQPRHQIMLISLCEQTMRAGDVDDTRRYPVSWVICHTMWTTLVSSCQRVNVNRE